MTSLLILLALSSASAAPSLVSCDTFPELASQSSTPCGGCSISSDVLTCDWEGDVDVSVSTLDGGYAVLGEVSGTPSCCAVWDATAELTEIRLQLEDATSVRVQADPAGPARLEPIGAGPLVLSVIGSDYDDTVLGSSSPDVILRASGGPGNDTIRAGGSMCWADGGPGADVIEGGHQGDYLAGGAGADRISAGAGPDVICGDAPANSSWWAVGGGTVPSPPWSFCGPEVPATDGDDTIIAGDGADVVVAGGGNDQITGGMGLPFSTHHEFACVSDVGGHDRLDGGGGDDLISGCAGDDRVFGGAGTDFLLGNDGNDSLHGGLGTDFLGGGPGDDTLADHSGLFFVEGDAGFDRVWYTGGDQAECADVLEQGNLSCAAVHDAVPPTAMLDPTSGWRVASAAPCEDEIEFVGGGDQDCDGDDLCYIDADADGFVAGVVGAPDCSAPGLSDSLSQGPIIDCDDTDATRTVECPAAQPPPGQDDDQDGFSVGAGDCDDQNDEIYPGATEYLFDTSRDVDCDWNTCDLDCDGVIDIDEVDEQLDDDGDGYSEVDGDFGCDTDPSIHRGRAESTDPNVDQDCDGVIDEDEDPLGRDDDGDGVDESLGDCDDNDASIGAPPSGDIADCPPSPFDRDGDGVCPYASCPDGLLPFDCDDEDASVFPGQIEVVDNLDAEGAYKDDDCDGEAARTCFVDEDLDRWGSTTTMRSNDSDCLDVGESPENTDCDDDDIDVHPQIPSYAAIHRIHLHLPEASRGAQVEVKQPSPGNWNVRLDGVLFTGHVPMQPGYTLTGSTHEWVGDLRDNDCDGKVPITCALDLDGDFCPEGGFGDFHAPIPGGGDSLPEADQASSCPTGKMWIPDPNDPYVCIDCALDPERRPGLPELADGIDNDCDGVIDPECHAAGLVLTDTSGGFAALDAVVVSGSTTDSLLGTTSTWIGNFLPDAQEQGGFVHEDLAAATANAIQSVLDVNGRQCGAVAGERSRVHLYSGLDLATAANPQPTLTLVAEGDGTCFGATISRVADIDGDGREELLVADPALDADLDGVAEGQVYLYCSGSSISGVVDALVGADHVFRGDPGSYLGWAMTGHPDISELPGAQTGLVLGAPDNASATSKGSIFIIPATTDLCDESAVLQPLSSGAANPGLTTLRGSGASMFGSALSGGGRYLTGLVDGQLVVGAPSAGTGPMPQRRGRVVVLQGAMDSGGYAVLPGTSTDVTVPTGTLRIRYIQPELSSSDGLRFGAALDASVSESACDAIAIGSDGGRAWMSDSCFTVLDTATGVQMGLEELESTDSLGAYDGPASWDGFGFRVSVLGDVNGDLAVDFAVGAPSENGRSALWMLYGPLQTCSGVCAWGSVGVDSSFILRDPPSSVTGIGASISATDYDRDGYSDVAVGVPGAGVFGPYTGGLYIVPGAPGVCAL